MDPRHARIRIIAWNENPDTHAAILTNDETHLEYVDGDVHVREFELDAHQEGERYILDPKWIFENCLIPVHYRGVREGDTPVSLKVWLIARRPIDDIDEALRAQYALRATRIWCFGAPRQTPLYAVDEEDVEFAKLHCFKFETRKVTVVLKSLPTGEIETVQRHSVVALRLQIDGECSMRVYELRRPCTTMIDGTSYVLA